MTDNFMKDKDSGTVQIFMLVVGRCYRLRVSFQYNSYQDEFEILEVRVKVPDGEIVQLKSDMIISTNGDREVVAEFKPESFKSQKLKQVSPTFGTSEEKYIQLNVTVKSRIDVEGGQIDFSDGKVVCKMFAYESRLWWQKIVRWWHKKWEWLPQTMRTCIKCGVYPTKSFPSRLCCFCCCAILALVVGALRLGSFLGL